MSRLTLLLVAACAFVAQTMAAEVVCPCGLDPATNCIGFLEGFTDSLNGTCSMEFGESECRALSSGATCSCPCGIDGEFCDEQRTAETYNFVAGFVIVFVIGAFAIFKIMKHQRQTGWKEFDIPSLEVAQPTAGASPKMMLFYRTCCFLLCFVTLTWRVAVPPSVGAGFLFLTYTVLNFTVLIIYFAMGCVLSWQSITGKLEDKPTMTTLQRIHLVTLEVELPNAIMLDLVVWTLLLPAAIANGDTSGILDYFSFVTHLINAFLIIGDFCLTNVQFTREHIYILVLWPLAYAVLHQGLMLNQKLNDANSCPIYPFLRMDTPFYSMWAIILLLVQIPFFLVARRLGLKYKTSLYKVSTNISFVADTNIPYVADASENSLEKKDEVERV